MKTFEIKWIDEIGKNGIVNPNRIMKAIMDSMDQIAENAMIDFKTTVATWKVKPEFKVKKIKGEDLIIRIYTDNEIYYWLNYGTKPHSIPLQPKQEGDVPRYIAYYKDGFRPKTRPGYIGSNKGAVANKNFIRRNFVPVHPGFEARKFDEEILKKWKSKVSEIISKNLTNSIR